MMQWAFAWLGVVSIAHKRMRQDMNEDHDGQQEGHSIGNIILTGCLLRCGRIDLMIGEQVASSVRSTGLCLRSAGNGGAIIMILLSIRRTKEYRAYS